jgi:hypothetical protein
MAQIAFFNPTDNLVLAEHKLMDVLSDAEFISKTFSDIPNAYGDTFKLQKVALMSDYTDNGDFKIPTEIQNYTTKKTLNESIAGVYYSAMDNIMNNSLMNFLYLSKEYIKTQIPANHKIDLVLKGGGALKYYYDGLVKDLKIQNPDKLPYFEKISDIDVDFYSHSISDDIVGIYVVQILKYVLTKYYNQITGINAVIFNKVNDVTTTQNKELLKIINSIDNKIVRVELVPAVQTSGDILLQKIKRYVYSSEVKEIIINDPIAYPANRNNIKDCFITFANEYEMCDVSLHKFSLGRLKNTFRVKMTDGNGVITYRNINNAIYDIGIPKSCNKGYIHNMMDIGNYVIEIPKKLSVYSMEYVIKDLYDMLFVQYFYPWTLNKYEKRLKRLIVYTCLLDLDHGSKDETLKNISSTINVFGRIITDMSINDTLEQYYNKITFLSIDLQRYRHQGSHIEILYNTIILVMYYFSLEKQSKEQGEMLSKFLDDHWTLKICSTANIIPVDSKVNLSKPITNQTVQDINVFKASLCKILNEVADFINILF